MEIVSIKNQNFSFSVQEGEICLLTGRVGCGKTSLLKRITRLCAPKNDTAEKITLLGRDIDLFSEKEITDTVGYLPQNIEGNFVCKKVYDEVCFHLRNQGIDEKTISQRCAFLCNELPLFHLLSKDIDTLSDGQKSLVALGGVIITLPKLLLLDEPCATMDSATFSSFIATVKRLCKGLNMGVIIATHAPELYKGIADSEVCLASVDDYKVTLPEENFGDETVKIKNLMFGYSRDSIVINGLDLSLKSGCVYSLTGQNGCGKTTLLKLICDMEKAKGGNIKKQGKSIYLPCNLNEVFIKDNLYDDLRFTLECNGIDMAQIDKIKAEYPFFKDIEQLFTKNPLDLSGGELRLAAVFKAMLLEPDILCFDEPSCGLDRELSHRFMEMIYSICKRQKTVIISTHSEDMINLCHRQLMLFNGQIVFESAPCEVGKLNLFGGGV